MYKINPNSYKSVFVLPTEIADKHLRMAGKAQLKVLLWLFRNSCREFDIGVISKETGIPADEIDDAVYYWTDAGIIISDGGSEEIKAEVQAVRKESVSEAPVPVQEKKEEKNEAEKAAEKPEAKPEAHHEKRPPVVKPSIQDISRRITEYPEIREMFSEAQNVLGRTLGYDGQSCLLLLHDYYGLPSEVIIMLCGYAKNIGKDNSLNYIMKIGASWSDEEINTFDRASGKIARLEKAQKLWNEFKNISGVENPRPTVKQTQYLEIWINDYGYGVEMIYHAYEKAVEKKGSINFGYMNGILKKWHEKGYRTVEDAETGEKKFSEKTAKGSAKDGGEGYTPPSYNIDLAIKRSFDIDPTKTKRGQ